MNKVYIKIKGIHCTHCINTITNSLLKYNNIKKVIIENNIATIYYIDKLNNKDIIDTIVSLGYNTSLEHISSDINKLKNNNILIYIITILSILLIIFILNKILGFNIFNYIPNIDSNITYSMLFITGLLTSIHCISMCGSINIISSINSKRSIKRPLLYNIGRVISYTIIGGIVGLIGSVLSINKVLSGTIILLAALFMLYTSLSMMGIVKIRNISIFNIHSKSSNPFIIGLLNGLMPCGPLQSMQLYALSTGSFIKGALSLFLFSLGTLPLMLFVGIVASILKSKSKLIFQTICPSLILILSLMMVNRGLLMFNIDLFKISDNSKYQVSINEGEYQIVEFDLDYDNYKDIMLKKNIPTKIIIHVDNKHLTGCNNEIIIDEFNIDKKLEVGDNIIEFTPNKTGTFMYTCWMNMIKNNIKVVD